MKSTRSHSITASSSSSNNSHGAGGRLQASDHEIGRHGTTRTFSTTIPPEDIAKRNAKMSRRGVCVSVCFIIIIVGIVVGVVVFKLSENNDDSNSSTSGIKNIFNNINNITSDTGSSGSDETDNTTDATTSSPTASPTQKCNGLENLCDVPANKVYYATVHNAMATTQDGVLVYPNHAKNLESALAAGYRGINVDIGNCPNIGLQFLHTTCILATRDPTTTVTHMLNFLSENTNEVILFPIQIEQNAEGGAVSLSAMNTLFESIDGFESQLYQHPGPDIEWPTLGQLIANNTRIIMMHYDANQRCSELKGGVCPPGFNEWFQYAAETQFENESIDQFNNLTYSCELTRGYTQPRNASDFIGMNFFLSLPNTDNCAIMNDKDFMLNHMQDCSNLEDYRTPNVLLVDCWDVGDVLEVVYELNSKL